MKMESTQRDIQNRFKEIIDRMIGLSYAIEHESMTEKERYAIEALSELIDCVERTEFAVDDALNPYTDPHP
jgi:hypothetical protein